MIYSYNQEEILLQKKLLWISIDYMDDEYKNFYSVEKSQTWGLEMDNEDL